MYGWVTGRYEKYLTVERDMGDLERDPNWKDRL